MDEQRYVIEFPDTASADAARYASELRQALLDADRDIQVERKRADEQAQDFGATLILVLGTPAIISAVRALGDWLKLRNSAKITIKTRDGEVVAENVSGRDARAILSQALAPKT